jgi:DNA-directed RNA polymerase subunit M/transcription elongation factor TFIIS
MLYIKYTIENEEHNLHLHCKFCNNIQEIDNNVPKLISRTSFKDDESINKWIKPDIEKDVTLPRVTNILCVNTECTKAKDKDNEIILVRYNKVDVKYIYFCVHCKKFWKND